MTIIYIFYDILRFGGTPEKSTRTSAMRHAGWETLLYDIESIFQHENNTLI